MQRLYLDMNVYIHIKTHGNQRLIKKIESLDKGEYELAYSVAHIEEVASSKYKGKSTDEQIEKDLEFFDTFPDKLLRPDPISEEIINGKKYVGHILIIDEDTSEIYENICREIDSNEKAEKINYDILIDSKNKDLEEIAFPEILAECHRPIINRLVEEDLLSIRDYDNVLLYKHSYLKEVFYLNEAYFNLAAINLQYFGNYKEKELKKKTLDKISRSWLHDVSHMIYASYCDIFICQDENLREKSKAIYKFLEASTLVLSIEEFLEYDINSSV